MIKIQRYSQTLLPPSHPLRYQMKYTRDQEERGKVLTTVEEREPTMEERLDPKTDDPRGSRPTSRISIGGILHDMEARAASNFAFLDEVD